MHSDIVLSLDAVFAALHVVNRRDNWKSVVTDMIFIVSEIEKVHFYYVLKTLINFEEIQVHLLPSLLRKTELPYFSHEMNALCFTKNEVVRTQSFSI